MKTFTLEERKDILDALDNYARIVENASQTFVGRVSYNLHIEAGKIRKLASRLNIGEAE